MNLGPARPAVCHVVYARYPADPRVRREAEALSRSGYDVDVICLRAEGEANQETLEDGVRVTRVPLRAIRGSRMRYIYQYMLFCLLAASYLMAKQVSRRYKAVHIHSMPDFLILVALPSRLLGCTVVLDLHESMPELYLARFVDREGSLGHRLTLVAQSCSCLLATRVVTVNDQIAALLNSRGIPRWQVCVIENAPDWTQSDDRTRASVAKEPFTIVIAGGLNAERDLEIVIDAAFEIARIVRIRLRLIGPGDPSYIDGLRSKVRSLGLEETVTVEPEVPAGAVAALVTGSTIGIVSYVKNPITEIATPNKAYAYAVAGKAMVVTDLPGLKSLLGDAVVYYKPGDAKDLARRVLVLLRNDELRRRLGQAVRARITAHAWPIMESRLIRMYQGLSAAEAVESSRKGTDGRSGRMGEA